MQSFSRSLCRALKLAVALVAVFAVRLTSSRKVRVENGVIALTEDDFHQAVHHFKLILVAFYDPESDWPKAERKQFERAAQHLRKSTKEPVMRLAKVDWWEHMKLAEHYNPEKQPWPVYKLFRDSYDYPFLGNRNAHGFTTFMENEQYMMTSKLQELVKELPFNERTGKADTDDFIAAAKEEQVALLGAFQALNSQQALLFKKLPWRDHMDHITFGISDDVSLGVRYKIGHFLNGEGGLMLFRSWEPRRIVYPDPFPADILVLQKWLERESRRPAVSNIETMKDAQKLATDGRPVQMYVFARDVQDESLQESLRFAHEHGHGMARVLCRAFGETGQDLRGGLRQSFDESDAELGDSAVMGVVIVRWGHFADGTMETKVYEMPTGSEYEAKMSSEGLGAALLLFENDFKLNTKTDKLRRKVASAAAVDDSLSPLKVVNGNEFHSRVMMAPGPVFMLFHTTEMESAKGSYAYFEEQLRRLAQTYRSSNVMIAKMDIELNELDHPKLALSLAYPSLILFPSKGKTDPVVFKFTADTTNDGKIDAALLVEWLTEHGVGPTAADPGGEEL
eukprot:g306.t1